MIIFLGILAIALLICFWANDFDWKDGEFHVGAVVCTIIATAILLICIGNNYSDYLDGQAYYSVGATTELNAIAMYQEGANSLDYGALTDSRGAGFQESLSGQVNALRVHISNYNNWYVSASLANDNPFVSWFYIGPSADMGTIVLTSDLKLVKNVGE